VLVDQVLVVKNGVVRGRTVKTGYRTLDFTEVLSGLAKGDHVVVADQDRLRPGQPVRQRMVGTGSNQAK
jgi:multidrug efflux pump subunit AcrA (membrane-fusion protein)